jgi:hypothetical protein
VVFLKFNPTVWTYRVTLKPWENAFVMEDVCAFEDPNNLTLNEGLSANGTLFVGFPHLHFTDFGYLGTQALYCLLNAILLHPEGHRVLKHELVELLRG